MESYQETIQTSVASRKLATVDAIYEFDADNAHVHIDSYEESDESVTISGETVLTGYKSYNATADSFSIDQAINVMTKLTTKEPFLEISGTGTAQKTSDVPSHTPYGESMTRVPSVASTTSTIHAGESENEFSITENLKTAKLDYSQSDKLSADEYDLVVRTWNSTERPYPNDQCVHELFEAQVVKAPNAIALVHGNRVMSYRELNHRANRLARQLIAAGVKHGDNVAMMLERSSELIVSQLAIAKIGAAYVPIDVKAPLDRQMYIASDSGTKLLITDESREMPVQLEVIVLRICADDENIVDEQADDLHLPCSSMDTAYIMYTSGSTGRPKGVMVNHRGIARFVINNGFAPMDADDRVAFVSNTAFDHNTFDIWAPLLNGARIVIIDHEIYLDPHRLAGALEQYSITAILFTTALFHQYAFIIGPALSKLKYVACAGEQGLMEAFVKMHQYGGRARLVNAYGPTEVTVHSTTYEFTSESLKLDRLPIGRPISNTRTYVLNKHGQPVSIGVVGELYIGGPGVANGYLNLPELTAERFLPDPFSSEPGARMYKSGDLVKYLPDGNIVFMGRNDDQVKIRGFRIELGEVEVRLAEHAQVREVAVLAIGEGSEKHLVAYVVSDPDDNLVSALREHLTAALPEYMIPSAFVRMDAFPLTNNGKIDRRALPRPDNKSFMTKDYVAPQGDVEIALAGIWSDLLKIDKVGRNDNFFMLGGHSLLAIQMIARLRCLELTLSVRALFENPVLSALAVSLGMNHDVLEVPLNTITPETTMITAEMLPLIDLTQEDIDHIVAQVPGGIANIQDIYGLSPLQDGVLFHHLMVTKGDTYLLLHCTAFDTRELLDRYLASFQKVVDRHDIMRTAVIYEGLTSPAQVVLRKATFSITELSLDIANGPIFDQVKKLYDPRQHRISLSEAPLIRFSAVQDVDGRWILAQQSHHLIADHSTLEFIQEEVEAFMNGHEESLPAPVPFRNVIAQGRLGVTAEEHEKFFSEMLGDVDTPSLPYGLSDIYNDGADATEAHLMLPQKLNDTLRGHAQRLGVSLASLCHLAWAMVVAGTSGQSPVVFGTVLFGRMQGGSGSERALGLFINTLPFRVDVEGVNVVDSVRMVQKDLAALLEYEHASLALAQRCSDVPSGTPLFSSLLNYRYNSAPSKDKESISGMEALSEDERTNYPFVLSVEDFGSSLGLTAQVVHLYDPTKFCQYMEQALTNLANSLQHAPGTFVQGLGILPADEHELIVHTWNNTDTLYPSDQCVHQLFEHQVEMAPEAVAVVHDNRSMTYRTLNNRANHLANKLIDLGVRPGDNVAMLLERSFELIFAQLAILKVGATYVPIDVKAPVDRQAYIALDSEAKLLITNEERHIPDRIQTPLLRISDKHEDTEGMQGPVAFSKPLQSVTSSLDTAYIMYTSGSTGRPKGVMVSHRGIARFVINNGFAPMDPDDRVAFVSNPAFDHNTFDVWTPLLNGARVVIIDNDTYLDPYRLAAALDHHQITALLFTTALFHQYASIIGPSLSKLKYLACAGEQGLVEAFVEMQRHGGNVRLVNAYGPTEVTVHSTTYEFTSTSSQLDRLPIGRPISNTRTYVLDKYRNPVPVGVVGELYIGGPGVANGYVNRPDLTAERFLPDPFSNVHGARMYKSGDLVRYMPDGNIVFMGRNDDQVKIRGFRIELGEIEVRLAEHPQVREVILLATGETSADKRLIAYVVSDPDDNLAQTLREYLATTLPEYMIPSSFVRMDSFPLTNNGKIDRRALPKPDDASLVGSVYEEPQGEIEIELAKVWSDLLKIERVGRHDNFFMLGGHSLVAIRMIQQLRQRGLSLSIRALFDKPVLRVLAASYGRQQSDLDIPSNLITSGTTKITPNMLPLIDLSQEDIDLIVSQIPGGVSNIQDIYALSALQDGILFHHMLATEGDPYLQVACTAFRDKELLDRYLHAFQKVVDRHDILRTAFVWKNLSTPAQVVLRQATLSVVEHSLDPSNGPVVDQLMELYNTRTYSMELNSAPLTRFAYAQEGDGRWILIQLLHHLIDDNTTFKLMSAETKAIMAGQDGDHQSPQPFRNLIAQTRLGVSAEEHEIFFRKMLGDIDNPSLPYGLSDVHNERQSVTESYQVLPQDLNDKLRAHAQRLGVTLASLCHLAWGMVISAISGQTQVVFGTVLFGRMRGSGSDSTLGPYINTLPFRVSVEDSSVVDAAQRVQTDVAALLEHEHASLAVAQRCSSVPSGMPLFGALLNYRHRANEVNETNTDTGVEHLGFHERTNYPFVLSVEDFGTSLGLTPQATQPYDPSRIGGYMHQALHSLADALEHTPEVSIHSLRILPMEEYNLVVHSWNNTDTLYPSDQCIHQLFEHQVEMAPEAVAVVHDNRSMTYRTLNNRANHLAHKLIDLGVRPGDNVAMLLERSFELIFAQLAILKVGATYVPIDVKAPVDRQAYIALDSEAKLLITNEERHIPDQIQTPLLRISDKHEDTEEMQGPVVFSKPLQSATSSLDTAYIMYTSGSTGRPKGVMVSHRGIARFVINNGFAPMDPDDRVAFVSNPAFDHNTFDVWTPLLNGARVVIIDNDTYLDPYRLAAALDHHQITALLFTTALFHQYASIIGPSLSKLKYLACAGEQGLVEAFVEMQRHGGNVRLVNAYGPTEVTVHSTTYEFTSTSSQLDRLPIGRPISNTRTYVLDKYRNPVPVGVVGELYIGGPGVANGYVNRPDLTAERFLPDPFSNVHGARMYKSGDLVRYMPDGNIVFMGRNDDQVKIRGFRIELGEIEVRLAEHPQVREVILLATGETSADKRLIAYVVSDPDNNLAQTLREYLATTLPEYMIPSSFVRMDSFPLTNNGKIDRRALPKPDDASLVGSVYEEPQGEIEIELAKVWSDLLKIDRVGRHDNFFMLGGHSLMAIRMIELLRQRGLSLSIRALFDKPVLHALAASHGRQQSDLDIPSNFITPGTTKITPNMLPLIDLSQEDIDLIVSQIPGGVSNIQDIYALSALQDGILFHHMLATEGDPYLQVACTAFRDKELLDRYLHAFQKVVDRHDILRTAFIWKNLSTPAQVVLRQATLSVVEHSLDPSNGPVVDQLMELYNTRTYSMELNSAPLTRFAYAQEGDGRWILIQLLHHLIDDNTTFKLMSAETKAIMAGQDGDHQSPQPFRNLIAQTRLGVSAEEHEIFFRKMLGDIDNPSLPYGLSDVHNERQSVTESYQVLPQDLNDKLRAHAQRLGVTLASLCHLAWGMVISAISGQTQVVFGTVLFGRMRGSGSDSTLGPYINTLPFRVSVEDSSVVDAAQRVQTDVAALLEHEHASLAVAQRCSSVPSGMPLFGALLNYRHRANEVNETNTDTGVEHLGFHERTNYPFVLSVEDFGTSLGLTPQATQPYDPSRIGGYMHQALHSLADALEHTPEVSIHSLRILPMEEYNLVVHSWNNTDTLYPSDQCVHQLFEHQVEMAPEAVAVVHDERLMTYRTLNNHANRLAHKLVGLGVKPGDNVAMLLERSFELIFAQLAILKVGATYVPIDVKAPVDRQAYIALDSEAKLLITNEERHIPDRIQTPLLRISDKHEDTEGMQGPVAFSKPLQSVTSSLDTAYIMYTSGSTGRPKGVMVSHRGIARFVINNGFAPMDPDDRVAFVSNPAFDHNTFDVWTPLLNGARVVIIDNDTYLDPYRLAAALDHHQITALLFTTALFHQYASIIGPSLSKLKYLACAGEQGLVEAFVEMQRHGGNVRLVNAYGPTEVTVHSTTYEFTSTSSQLDRLPIGRPISNTRTYVLDKYRNPVPVGVVGELYIGGPGVANGYVNRPDLTAERFLPDPFSNVHGARMYKSGDLVRYMPDGNIVFMGRNDDQVKIRGFRIELGEIEVRLAEHPQVREVILLATGETSADKRLIAYVVSDPDDNLAQKLREYLATTLPEYMIPSSFVRMDSFPLTNNGKIDRRALPNPDSESFVTKEYAAPEGEIELALAGIWSDLLKIDQIGRHDNFFVVGGHSLMAMRMISSVQSKLGFSLKLKSLFTSPTIAELAKSLVQGSPTATTLGDDEYSVLLPLKSGGSRPPLFCIHPGQGLSWIYMGLVKHLDSEQPLYGLQARGLDGKAAMAGSVEEMTKDYLAHVCKIQPHGPYHLLGWSFGGTVAHSMAVELEKQGEKVSLLAMMDSVCDFSVYSNDDDDEYEQDEKEYVQHLSHFAGKSSIGGGLTLQERIMPISANNSDLAGRFRPSVFGGNVTYFRAAVPSRDKAPLVDPASWAPYVRGKMAVYDVACKHLEMDRPENIAVVGTVVAAEMEKLF